MGLPPLGFLGPTEEERRVGVLGEGAEEEEDKRRARDPSDGARYNLRICALRFPKAEVFRLLRLMSLPRSDGRDTASRDTCPDHAGPCELVIACIDFVGRCTRFVNMKASFC